MAAYMSIFPTRTSTGSVARCLPRAVRPPLAPDEDGDEAEAEEGSRAPMQTRARTFNMHGGDR